MKEKIFALALTAFMSFSMVLMAMADTTKGHENDSEGISSVIIVVLAVVVVVVVAGIVIATRKKD